MKNPSLSSPRRRQPYVVAMVLGTALSTLGGAVASEAVPAETSRAVTDISRYCTACWRHARLPPDAWGDCTQEVFCRLLERVTPEAWGQVLTAEGDERRELVRAIDTVKKRTQRSRKWYSGLVETAADPQDGPSRRLADDRAAVRQAAEELLSPRQQRILELSFDGWSVQDIATDLRLPPERVSDDKYKAIQKLRSHFDVVS